MKKIFKTDIVILGAGIGGYEAFRTLNRILKRRGIGAHITIIDQNNYFTFVPLLHEVATGSVEPTHASIPLRELVYGTPHNFIKAKIEKLDRSKREVHTSAGIVSYTYCVIALGSTTNFYGVPGAEKYAYHVRNLEDALVLKHSLVSKLETCVSDEFVITIVGGGFVGVEIAGQYGTLKKGDIQKLYPEKKLRIQIIEPNASILSTLGEKVQSHVKKRLESMGIEFIFNSSASEVTADTVVLSTGEKIQSDITIWAAGFANMGTEFVETEACERGRIKVEKNLRMVDDTHCYAIGDIAHVQIAGSSRPLPQLAEVAHRQGRYVGRHIADMLSEKKTKPFVFKSKGQLMPVGDWYGVAIMGTITFYGWFAWWIRRTVYVMYMPGILRKLRIVFDWTVHSLGFGHFIYIEKSKK